MYKLTILSLEKTVFDGKVHSLIAKSTGGDLEVLSHHANLVTPLKAGEVRVEGEGGERLVFKIGGGILEVEHGEATIFCD